MKLTLRELCWLTVVVAMACAWWVQYRATEKHCRAVEQEYVQLYKAVHFIQSRSRPGGPPVWSIEFDAFPIGSRLVAESGGTVPSDFSIPHP